MTDAEVGELVVLRLNKQVPVRDVIESIRYPSIDVLLYDTSAVRADLEAIWGVQEALSGTIQTAKTATEAMIQQSGTQARTGMMRSRMESVLSELLHMTIEVALQTLSANEVRQIAGTDSVWPVALQPEDLDVMLSVDLRAGSTGKPNFESNMQAWATVMPILQNIVAQVAQLNQSEPLEIARALKEIVIETMSRTGDRSDPARFLPQAPQAGVTHGTETGNAFVTDADITRTPTISDLTGIAGPIDPNR